MNKSLVQERVIEMCEGNPGALNFLLQLVKAGKVETLFALDAYGIRGQYLWSVYKDLCDEDLSKVETLVRKCPRELFINAARSWDRNGKRKLVEHFFQNDETKKN